jgi:hypothetical protein
MSDFMKNFLRIEGDFTANFFCKNCTCGKNGNFSVEVSSQNDAVFCPNSSEPIQLHYMGIDMSTNGIKTGKFDNGRPKHESEKRRLKNFKDNEFGSLGGFEKKHFEKKFKEKGI